MHRDFIDHMTALVTGNVPQNVSFCTALGVFTLLGIGWELLWFCCTATQAFLMILKVSLSLYPRARIFIDLSICKPRI